jgi:hypothetical protein
MPQDRRLPGDPAAGNSIGTVNGQDAQFANVGKFHIDTP